MRKKVIKSGSINTKICDDKKKWILLLRDIRDWLVCGTL